MYSSVQSWQMRRHEARALGPFRSSPRSRQAWHGAEAARDPWDGDAIPRSGALSSLIMGVAAPRKGNVLGPRCFDPLRSYLRSRHQAAHPPIFGRSGLRKRTLLRISKTGGCSVFLSWRPAIRDA